MLASTVQFSTYDRSLPSRPRRPRGLPREARRYENRRAPTEFTVARSLRTQQRAYNRSIPVHHVPHPLARAVLAATRKAGRTGQRSTLEHHPRRSAATRDRATVTAWARLCTTPTRRAVSAP